MEKLLIEEFGINPIEIIKINGYDNLNYLIKTNSKNYILKTYEDLTLIDLIQSDPSLQSLSKVEQIIKIIDTSFFGLLKKKSIQMKKIRVLEIYRYLYRFSYLRT